MFIVKETTTLRHVFVLVGGHVVGLLGGPYYDRDQADDKPWKGLVPRKPIWVKMAVEIEEPCDYSVPTRDFDTPNTETLRRVLFHVLLQAIDEHRVIGVGCMGGVGRTGLFIAAVAKIAGVDSPITWTRAHYREHAVETEDQRAFVTNLETQDIKRALKYATSYWGVCRWWGRNVLSRKFR